MTQKVSFGLSSDFSSIASSYDASRDIPEQYLLECYDRLIGRGLFPGAGTILDAGCGTGQMSLPLARRAYEVHGIDISVEMIKLAQSKVHPGWRARYEVGDVRALPFSDGTIDTVVVSKLFQHIEDWREACSQLIRVVRPGSYIVHINERGAFGNAVRRHFSKLADKFGFNGRYVGLNPHSNTEIVAFMTSQGCEVVPVDTSDLRWTVEISYGEAINRIQQRLFAEFWYLPSNIYAQLIADTAAWVEAQPNGRNNIESLKPFLAVEVFRTPA